MQIKALKLKRGILSIAIYLTFILGTVLTIPSTQLQKYKYGKPFLSIFYCGFGGAFCGQSSIDDVNPSSNMVILAFANILQNGSILIDQYNLPFGYKNNWQRNGKVVLFSIGGQNGQFDYVFETSEKTQNFIRSVSWNVDRYGFDGVDLNIQRYRATPRTVANMIISLKNKLMSQGRKILTVTPEDVTVFQGVAASDPDRGGNPWNYFVPIINLADNYIDFYQVQAYNNGYGFNPGSVEYFQEVYLNWRNYKSLNPYYNPLPNFLGVRGQKLIIGFLASQKAGISGFYGNQSVLQQFKRFLSNKNYPIGGFFIWSSNWDRLNNNTVSKVLSQQF